MHLTEMDTAGFAGTPIVMARLGYFNSSLAISTRLVPPRQENYIVIDWMTVGGEQETSRIL